MRSFKEIKTDINSYLSTGDVSEIRTLAREMLALGSIEAEAAAMHAIGAADRLVSDFSSAHEHFSHALALHEKMGDSLAAAHDIIGLGMVAYSTGNYTTALKHYYQSLALFRDQGERAGTARVLGELGNVYYSTGDYLSATKHYHHALDAFEDLQDLHGIARLTNSLGIVTYSTSDYPKALEYYQNALEMHKRLHNQVGIAIATSGIGNVLFSIGNYPAALEHFHKAKAAYETTGSRIGVAVAIWNIGFVYSHIGDADSALQHFRDALELFEECGSRARVAHVMGNVISALLDLGRLDEASNLLDVQADLVIDDPQIIVVSRANRAHLAELKNDLDTSHTNLLEALSLASDAGLRSESAQIHEKLRDLAQKRNDFAGYIEHNNEYQRITEEINGKATAQKLAMMEAQKQIDAERQEKEKHRALLHNTLPPSIADRVLRGEQVNDTYENAVVLFMDLVGFTTMSSTMDPGNVVSLMNEIFTTCDEIIATHGLMKIKTIGDSYMAVAFPPQVPHVVRDDSTTAHQASGDGVIPSAARNIAECAAHAALEMLQTISQVRVPTSSPEGSPESSHVRVRLGLHCGPLTAGVIGTQRLQYDVWGDTVNVASRMESTSEPGRIHVSEAFASSLGLRPRNDSSSPGSDERKSVIPNEVWNEEPGTWHLALRGETELKGKGTMTTYWLEPA